MKNYMKLSMRLKMENQDKYNVKDTIILDDNIEYSIIKKVDNYYLMMSVEEPLKIIIGQIDNNKIIVISDKKIIKEVLSS